MKIPVHLEQPFLDTSTTVMDDLKIGVVILNWNKPVDTMSCIKAVQSSNYQNHEIIVVDNASSDESVKMIQQVHPEIDIVQIKENLGYTGGNNLGIRYLIDKFAGTKTGPDYFLLLNEDTYINENTLVALTSTALRYPEAGFLGPKVLFRDDPKRFLSAGGILDKGYLPYLRGAGEIDQGQYEDVCSVDYLSGCALMVSKRVIDDIGLLDEDYFMYFEEIDWCYRAKEAGFSSIYVPTARAWHPNTGLRDAGSAVITYYAVRNHLLFAQRNHLGWTNQVKLWRNFIRLWLAWTVQPRWRSKRMEKRALKSALIDFIYQRFGKWKSAA